MLTTAFTPSHRGGAGTTLVLLRGFSDTWRMWELLRTQARMVEQMKPLGPHASSSTPSTSRAPVRIVCGTADKILPWPSSATRLRTEWLPHADWVELDGVGHCPPLDVPLETAQRILGFTAH